MYRSPGGPPFIPAWPSPDNRMRVPSSTPGGMSTDSVRSFCIWPEPLHCLHGLRTTRPAPRHFGHVRSMVKKPWLARTFPCPEQVEQVSGLLPASAPEPLQLSHSTRLGTRI